MVETIAVKCGDKKLRAVVTDETVSIQELLMGFNLEQHSAALLQLNDSPEPTIVPLDKDGRLFRLLPGWRESSFELGCCPTSGPPSASRPTTPSTELSSALVNRTRDVLLYFILDGTRMCATVLNTRLAATASHCLKSSSHVNDNITLFDQSDTAYEAKIILIREDIDVCLLQPTSEECFSVKTLPIDFPKLGSPYITLGYPSDADNKQQFIDSPSVLRGCIITRPVRGFYVYGDSGGSKGFFGGPVISIDGGYYLVGIALGKSGLPNSWPTRDFMPRLLAFTGEAPRLKIMPAPILPLLLSHAPKKDDADDTELCDTRKRGRDSCGSEGMKKPRKE